MKYLLSAIIVSILSFTCVSAQDKSEGLEAVPQLRNEHANGQNERKYPTREEIQSQKIAFFTQELDLTPDEAQKFWPVYNTNYKKAETIRKEINQTLKKVNEILKTNPSTPESEIEELMEKYFNALEEEDKIYADTYKELCKVIPIKKAAKTFTLEERFRVLLIRQLRRNN